MKIHPFKAAVGFLVLFLSVILLLTTSGFAAWGLWLFVWQFWPMLFVIFGMAFLMRRWDMNLFVGMAFFLLVFAGMGTGLWLTWKEQYFSTNNFAEMNVRGMTQTKLSNEMPKKTEKADVKIAFGSSKIKVDALSDINSGLLYEGTHDSNFFTLNQKMEVVGEKTKLSFKSSPFIKKPFSPKSVNELNLNLSQKPIYSFNIETGASDIDLNLDKLKVSNLDIDAGASELMIKLGDSDSTDVHIKSGASLLRFYLPKDVAVRVNSKSAFSSKNFEDFGLTKKNKSWESPGWNSSKKKITVDIDSGVSKIEFTNY
ncbi:MAG: hypothetical protein Q7S53_00755 [bacterium]|nr:hypothetical protein [bacterium]